MWKARQLLAQAWPRRSSARVGWNHGRVSHSSKQPWTEGGIPAADRIYQLSHPTSFRSLLPPLTWGQVFLLTPPPSHLGADVPVNHHPGVALDDAAGRHQSDVGHFRLGERDAGLKSSRSREVSDDTTGEHAEEGWLQIPGCQLSTRSRGQ